MLTALASAIALGAHAETDAELATTAKFIIQLTRHVSWPESAHRSGDTPIVIGVLDKPALAESLLLASANKRVHGRSVEILTLESAEGAAAAHLLFVPSKSRSTLRRIARLHQDGNVLTVSDEFDFPELGGDVGIELVRNRVSFSINRRKVVRGDFSISSKLMRLASEVE